MKVCTTCDVEYEDTERFCPRDGTPLRSRDAGADLVGSVVADRYHVLRKLGEGGMGQVFLAEHVRLKRKSAVKVMHPVMTNDADALGRFNREAANASQIDHPNVAAIYDFGESGDGVVYLAMEYVEGASLARVIANSGALAIHRVADITSQIANGLDAAHRLGIVHRDLKPDNILVGSHHDGRDKVKVVDFGISKAMRTEGQTVTRTGQVVGTPDYMSPEQLSGETIDHRSDVYALAIVAFNMLTGRLPFESNSAHTSMLLRLREPPARLRDARPDIGWTAELQSVLDRAMELNVDRRHASASAFAAALTEAASHLPAAMSTDASTMLLTVATPGGQTAAAPSPSIVAPALSFPVASGLSPGDVAAIEARLAKLVGPIARVLVRRAAATAPTRSALIAALAGEIEDEGERSRFQAG